MSSSNRAPQRDGKAPASPVSPSPPAPLLRQSTFSADYWDSFYIGWKMALQKASRLYDDKGLNNILPDIGHRVEHIPSSPSSPDLYAEMITEAYSGRSGLLSILSYLDDLHEMKNANWAAAIHEYLISRVKAFGTAAGSSKTIFLTG
ncbi:hypothetical protein Taro_042328, partial [Colocasia esculenta]|nr:hypothetical protein [Colocasia esculenta]